MCLRALRSFDASVTSFEFGGQGMHARYWGRRHDCLAIHTARILSILMGRAHAFLLASMWEALAERDDKPRTGVVPDQEVVVKFQNSALTSCFPHQE
jgi:hypothetical protein